MQGYFRCFHSGKCCTTPFTPVNVSMGDVIRIAESSGIEHSKILNDNITLRPFGDPEHPDMYTLDFGLHLPCTFRKGNICSIHKNRPINCRLFPYWLVVQAYKTKDDGYLDRTYTCMSKISIDKLEESTIEAYISYIKEIGGLLLKELDFNDYVLKKLDCKEIDVSKLDGYSREGTAVEREPEKIKLLEPFVTAKVAKAHQLADLECSNVELKKIAVNNQKVLDKADEKLKQFSESQGHS